MGGKCKGHRTGCHEAWVPPAVPIAEPGELWHFTIGLRDVTVR